MTLKAHFALLARYNNLVNDKMYDIVAELPEEKRRRDVGAYFRSIHGILNHIIVSDYIWLRRFRGWHADSVVLSDPRVEPPTLALGRDLYERFDELHSARKVLDGVIASWIDELAESRYEQLLSYTDSAGRPREFVVWQAIGHFFNHQTHHRGQVSEVLDEMQVEHDYSNLTAIL